MTARESAPTFGSKNPAAPLRCATGVGGNRARSLVKQPIKIPAANVLEGAGVDVAVEEQQVDPPAVALVVENARIPVDLRPAHRKVVDAEDVMGAKGVRRQLGVALGDVDDPA